jgi:arsenite methyltransferase
MSIPTDQKELRDVIREKYAAAATVATGENASAAACRSAEGAIVTEEQRAYFGSSLYDSDARDELHAGETVLDLGSGGGIDVLLSARRVGPTGLAYGLDMTDEMLDLARRNQAEAGVTNVQWLRGHIEEIPLPRTSVDVVISNCVINLSGDKPRVLREAARVLKPGGRFAVSDVVADDGMDDATRADMQAYTGCIAGALTRVEFTEALQAAGLTDITITETHRVHPAAISAIVRATKPADGTNTLSTATGTTGAAACCSTAEESTCCEPTDKATCCSSEATAGGSCGCQ